jgi:hypothetical protein
MLMSRTQDAFLNSPPPTGATTRKWPPRRALPIPRPLGVVEFFFAVPWLTEIAPPKKPTRLCLITKGRAAKFHVVSRSFGYSFKQANCRRSNAASLRVRPGMIAPSTTVKIYRANSLC